MLGLAQRSVILGFLADGDHLISYTTAFPRSPVYVFCLWQMSLTRPAKLTTAFQPFLTPSHVNLSITGWNTWPYIILFAKKPVSDASNDTVVCELSVVAWRGPKQVVQVLLERLSVCAPYPVPQRAWSELLPSHSLARLMDWPVAYEGREDFPPMLQIVNQSHQFTLYVIAQPPTPTPIVADAGAAVHRCSVCRADAAASGRWWVGSSKANAAAHTPVQCVRRSELLIEAFIGHRSSGLLSPSDYDCRILWLDGASLELVFVCGVSGMSATNGRLVIVLMLEKACVKCGHCTSLGLQIEEQATVLTPKALNRRMDAVVSELHVTPPRGEKEWTNSPVFAGKSITFFQPSSWPLIICHNDKDRDALLRQGSRKT